MPRPASMNKIVFLLPRSSREPIGGFKVVFEYANRLAADGFKVEIVYPRINDQRQFDTIHTLLYGQNFIYKKLTGKYKTRWFALDKRIKQRWVWRLDNCKLGPNDTIVATSVETAFSLQRNKSKTHNQRTFYFIQDFENWSYTDEQVFESYRLPMQKLVVSRWLQQVITTCGEKAVWIPNGFDFSYFQLTTPPAQRNKYTLVCMYHQDARKDLPTAFKAMAKVKEKYPQLHITMFGAYPPPALPAGYAYHQRPNKALFNAIYNEAAIYVAASKIEGWGLTIGEAMQCGCAVACTDNKGYLEMAHHETTALVSAVGDAEALAHNIIRLIEDDALRERIARTGNTFIHGMDIHQSYHQLKEELTRETPVEAQETVH